MSDLKPCPFCGDMTPEIAIGERKHFVVCTNFDECGAEGHRALVDDYAIECWNRRAADSHMMEWQPIETAPKDGTCILVYFANAKFGSKMGSSAFENGKWVLARDPYTGVPAIYCKYKPTHWQPLPEAPR